VVDWINARIASHRDKMEAKEKELSRVHTALQTLTEERDELKMHNAAWAELQKKSLASALQHKAIIEDLLQENLKLTKENVELQISYRNMQEELVKCLRELAQSKGGQA
jgi:predicted nuclease with TOPRIM domain